MRTRQLQELRADAYLRADMQGAEDRHTSADVTRYLNQGGAALWDRLIAARGREWARAATPWSITTTANTTSYALASDFYLLISARLDGVYGGALVPFTDQEEPIMRRPGIVQATPGFYEVRRAPSGASSLAVLPKHRPAQTIIVEYVPVYADMTGDTDTFDGINGWEEYVVVFAARCMATRDALWDLVRALDGDIERLEARIAALAPKRDMMRARRVKDVRGPRTGVRRWS